MKHTTKYIAILIVALLFALVPPGPARSAPLASGGTGFSIAINPGKQVSYVVYDDGIPTLYGRVLMRACIPNGAMQIQFQQNWLDGEGWRYQDTVLYPSNLPQYEDFDTPWLWMVPNNSCLMGVTSDNPSLLKSLLREIYLPVEFDSGANVPMFYTEGGGLQADGFIDPYPAPQE
jgi:hypothetical protein